MDFQWLREHEQALNNIKESESVLCFYDPIASNTPLEGQVAHPVTIASPSTSPEKVPTETTSPVEVPITTPQAPKRTVSEREKKKQNGWTIMNIDFLEQCHGTRVF